MNIYIFRTKDELIDGKPETLQEFEFSVKREFLNIVPNPEKLTPHILFSKYEMQNYLHNENGPAATVIEFCALNRYPREGSASRAKRLGIPGYEEGIAPFGEYWLNGVRVDQDTEQKMLKEYVDFLKQQEQNKTKETE